jgi:hypothetical protein
VARPPHPESSRGLEHSGTLRAVARRGCRASVPECGSPLPLLADGPPNREQPKISPETVSTSRSAVTRPSHRESSRGLEHSGTLRAVARRGCRASVPECGRPLPLLADRLTNGNKLRFSPKAVSTMVRPCPGAHRSHPPGHFSANSQLEMGSAPAPGHCFPRPRGRLRAHRNRTPNLKTRPARPVLKPATGGTRVPGSRTIDPLKF